MAQKGIGGTIRILGFRRSQLGQCRLRVCGEFTGFRASLTVFSLRVQGLRNQNGMTLDLLFPFNGNFRGKN